MAPINYTPQRSEDSLQELPPVGSTFDPSHDVLHYNRMLLDSIFCPKAVAVIGATESPRSVGRTLFWNLISSPFGGPVFPVNPKRSSVLGVKAYASIPDIPEKVDLAVIATPAKTVLGVIQQCVDHGIKGAIIISAGFKEVGEDGAALERKIMEIAAGKMRIVGPNCLGLMNPVLGLNATFASTIAKPGNIGFISQSGALCTAVLDSLREKVGFSAFISVGSMMDVSWGDLLFRLGDDVSTSAIICYMETIGDARSFLSAAREVALTKPIIVIKPGRSSAAAKAAASHTGSLTGSDDVLDMAFRRSGVLRVNSIAELFYMAEILDKQPRPKGRRLTILTNAGGPGVLATDALIMNGGQLAELAPETIKKLNTVLPSAWSHNNPIDILGDAPPERYAQALEIASQDPNSDGILVILTPQAMSDPTATAEAIVPYAGIKLGKPVLVSWMGGHDVADGAHVFSRVHIPNFPYPDTAARMFLYMAQYADNLEHLYETPMLDDAEYVVEQADGTTTTAGELTSALIEKVKNTGRTILTEHESKIVLSYYGIPTVLTHIAATADAAVAAAEKIGYPVVLKIHSETITHKTDVGGVQLNLSDATAVREAFTRIQRAVTSRVGAEHFLGVTVQSFFKIPDGSYELILGSSLDAQFGPVLLFGLGGSLVEVFKDSSLGLPPLSTTLARHMMEKTKIYKALKGVRGHPACDLPALEKLMVRFSRLIAEQPWIKELDINPLVVSPPNANGQPAAVALDARVVIHTSESTLPKLAIRPYPTQYVSRKQWTAPASGKTVTALIRPIRPEDEPGLAQFHTTLSTRSVTQRYLHPHTLEPRISHNRLARICHTDYDRGITLVCMGTNGHEGEIMGASRVSKLHDSNDAVFTVLVGDEYQGTGVGTQLVEQIKIVGKGEGWKRLRVAEMGRDNVGMKKVLERAGFKLYDSKTDADRIWAELDL
ncbi:N-acetyltransferase GCN5 [Cladochytrium replicatum]|nr:N-acetyltransferase GCN5 [Cladochytrium replicatum]